MHNQSHISPLLSSPKKARGSTERAVTVQSQSLTQTQPLSLSQKLLDQMQELVLEEWVLGLEKVRVQCQSWKSGSPGKTE